MLLFHLFYGLYIFYDKIYINKKFIALRNSIYK